MCLAGLNRAITQLPLGVLHATPTKKVIESVVKSILFTCSLHAFNFFVKLSNYILCLQVKKMFTYRNIYF